MIKISVDATVLHLMVDDKATLALKLSDGTYVDFPIYDESFQLVKAGKKFRLTLEEVEMEEVGSLLEGTKPAAEAAKDVYKAMNDVLAENSKMVKIPYHIIDELRRDVAALGVIKKALNQLEVRNEERLASYPDPEIEAHRKRIQEVIAPETKKVEGMITGTAGGVSEVVNKENEAATPMVTPCDLCFHVKEGYAKEGVCFECKDFHMLDIPPQHGQSAAEVQEKYIKWDRYDKPSDNSAKTDPLLFGKDFTTISMYMSNPPQPVRPMSDEEVTEFIKTRSEYQEEIAQECQGSFDKGPFCDWCKHNGVNPESGPCAVCFEGMMYDSDKGGAMENEDTPDEEFKYNARKWKCGKCANSSNPSACVRCIDYSKFEPSRYK